MSDGKRCSCHGTEMIKTRRQAKDVYVCAVNRDYADPTHWAEVKEMLDKNR